MIGLRLKRILSVCRLQVRLISYKKTIAVWYANAILPSGYAAALKFDGQKRSYDYEFKNSYRLHWIETK